MAVRLLREHVWRQPQERGPGTCPLTKSAYQERYTARSGGDQPGGVVDRRKLWTGGVITAVIVFGLGIAGFHGRGGTSAGSAGSAQPWRYCSRWSCPRA